jgi:hypothetical protein
MRLVASTRHRLQQPRRQSIFLVMVRHRARGATTHAPQGAVDEGKARKEVMLKKVVQVSILAVTVACILPILLLLTGPSAHDARVTGPRALGVRAFQALPTPSPLCIPPLGAYPPVPRPDLLRPIALHIRPSLSVLHCTSPHTQIPKAVGFSSADVEGRGLNARAGTQAFRARRAVAARRARRVRRAQRSVRRVGGVFPQALLWSLPPPAARRGGAGRHRGRPGPPLRRRRLRRVRPRLSPSPGRLNNPSSRFCGCGCDWPRGGVCTSQPSVAVHAPRGGGVPTVETVQVGARHEDGLPSRAGRGLYRPPPVVRGAGVVQGAAAPRGGALNSRVDGR